MKLPKGKVPQPNKPDHSLGLKSATVHQPTGASGTGKHGGNTRGKKI
ncbi:MAG TPA: hypothetical protein VHI13_08815 [Candidatus Kapabacteria bacterium]|nr:hypothetical protein [Candidatus Kapabacteria bacterium]